eukprot:8317585-Pyramimonas_sp.AAC.3
MRSEGERWRGTGGGLQEGVGRRDTVEGGSEGVERGHVVVVDATLALRHWCRYLPSGSDGGLVVVHELLTTPPERSVGCSVGQTRRWRLSQLVRRSYLVGFSGRLLSRSRLCRALQTRGTMVSDD